MFDFTMTVVGVFVSGAKNFQSKFLHCKNQNWQLFFPEAHGHNLKNPFVIKSVFVSEFVSPVVTSQSTV